MIKGLDYKMYSKASNIWTIQGLYKNYKSKVGILKVQLYFDMEFMFGILVL